MRSSVWLEDCEGRHVRERPELDRLELRGVLLGGWHRVPHRHAPVGRRRRRARHRLADGGPRTAARGRVGARLPGAGSRAGLLRGLRGGAVGGAELPPGAVLHRREPMARGAAAEPVRCARLALRSRPGALRLQAARRAAQRRERALLRPRRDTEACRPAGPARAVRARAQAPRPRHRPLRRRRARGRPVPLPAARGPSTQARSRRSMGGRASGWCSRSRTRR